MPAIPSFVEALEWGERLFFIDATQSIACGRQALREGLDGPLLRMVAATADWNVPLKMGNQMIDLLANAMRQKDYGKRQLALGEFEAQAKELADEARRPFSLFGEALRGNPPPQALGRRVGAILASSLMPDVILSQIDEFSSPIRLDLSRLALTLAAYQRQRGQYPESLDLLTPDWIDSLPVDRFNGQPLRYQRRGQAAVLYSVGPNQIDENGVGERSSQRTGNKDDICVTLLK